MTGTLSELTCLVMRRPAADAVPADVAGFYAALANVHEHLAADTAAAAERARELRLAASARRRAARLLSLVPTTTEDHQP